MLRVCQVVGGYGILFIMIVTKIKAAGAISNMKWARITAVITIGVCTGALDTC